MAGAPHRQPATSCGHGPHAQRRSLYTVSEYHRRPHADAVDGGQPAPGLEPAVAIIEQVARGLRAFHRLEIVHQDLRPDNIHHAGRHRQRSSIWARLARPASGNSAPMGDDAMPVLGTAQYAAPEYFLGEAGTRGSDIYSLAAILYQMLSGRLPTAPRWRSRSRAAQLRLTCVVPCWTGNAKSQPGSTACSAAPCIPIRSTARPSCPNSRTRCAIRPTCAAANACPCWNAIGGFLERPVPDPGHRGRDRMP